MHKLNEALLTGLGAPAGGGAQQIEDWLRGLLRGGSLRLDKRLVELRGPEPVVTTLGELKRACGVAVETVKHGLRTLEMDHWVMLVDGAHTRLLGPPRFRVSVSKENLWGSVGGSIEIAALEGLSPLESIDYERLGTREAVWDCKQTLSVESVDLKWSAQARLTSGREILLERNTEFLLAAGSYVRTQSGQSGVLSRDLKVAALGGRGLRASERGDVRLPGQGASTLEAGGVLELERGNILRLASGETGILSIAPIAMAGGEPLDWGDDGHWLGRFRPGGSLVLLRRAIYATLKDVVVLPDVSSGAGESVWKVVLGVHDCVLDGSIPFRAGLCAAPESESRLIAFLRTLGANDSLRTAIRSEFGFQVEASDVRVSPTAFALGYDRKLLRQAATDPRLNSEILAIGQKVACWTQVGAYSRAEDPFPWEVTREIYFPHVALHCRQPGS